MGTVHGVYLKYVGLSALSYAGYLYLSPTASATEGGRSLLSLNSTSSSSSATTAAACWVLGYSTLVNGTIAILFKLERGMGLIGKDKQTGKIPIWSYILWFPFHGPTWLYTYIHTKHSKFKQPTKENDPKELWVRSLVPYASQVQPGWYVGGCYAYELPEPTQWGGVLDLTVEFPEGAIDKTHNYLSLPTWDGVPATPAQLEMAATWAVQARQQGPVLVHCAHGRGRSTTVLCACLVKAGLFETWQEAFEKGIQPRRTVCKLNRRMQENLQAWQDQYVAKKE